MANCSLIRCSAVAWGLLMPAVSMAEEPPPTMFPEPETGGSAVARTHFSLASVDAHVAEAATRFGLHAHLIRAVIAAESAGNPRAVSAKGAMGLMQIMPATWAELRAVHRLGADPFDPGDNILAGTAYLRELYDRFGAGGFLAAYNAGPTRYAEHLATGRPLPPETRVYVARLAPVIDGSDATRRARDGSMAARDWRAAGIFEVPVAQPAGSTSANSRMSGPQVENRADRAGGSIDASAAKLFVPLRSRNQP